MREVICLRAISDFSYREIGKLLGKSENWARVSFYRGKELLLKMRERKPEKGVLVLYTILTMFYAMCTIRQGGSPFGIAPHKLGPLMSAQFKITILISLIFVIFYLYQVGNKKIRYSLWCNTSILCIFLNLTYDSTLYRMESFDTITTTLFRNTVILFAAALIASFLLWLQGKFRKK